MPQPVRRRQRTHSARPMARHAAPVRVLSPPQPGRPLAEASPPSPQPVRPWVVPRWLNLLFDRLYRFAHGMDHLHRLLRCDPMHDRLWNRLDGRRRSHPRRRLCRFDDRLCPFQHGFGLHGFHQRDVPFENFFFQDGLDLRSKRERQPNCHSMKSKRNPPAQEKGSGFHSSMAYGLLNHSCNS